MIEPTREVLDDALRSAWRSVCATVIVDALATELRCNLEMPKDIAEALQSEILPYINDRLAHVDDALVTEFGGMPVEGHRWRATDASISPPLYLIVTLKKSTV